MNTYLKPKDGFLPRQQKKLSQIFLKDAWPCERVAASLRERGILTVVEIGPGGGILTEHLLAQSLKVIAIEKDPRFSDYLQKEKFAGVSSEQLRIVNENFLSTDLNALLSSFDPKTTAICGNIPYHLSTALVEKVLQHFSLVSYIVFLTQEEFARRLCATHGSKDYGSLSIFAQLRSQPRYEFSVPRSAFKPVPKVDSAVLSFHPPETEHEPDFLAKMEKLSKALFSQRRKQLRNSLKPFLSTEHHANFPFDLTRRPETLSIQEFVELGRFLATLD